VKAWRGLWLMAAAALIMLPSLALAARLNDAGQAGLLALVVVGMLLALIMG
jgi:cell division protein FtsW (lipid II flippase)